MTQPHLNPKYPTTGWKQEPVNAPLWHVLAQSAQAYPKRIAIDFLGTTLTYDALHQQAQTFAANLKSHGLKVGDCVALCLPNCPAYVVSYFGVLYAGGIVVNCNPLLTQGEIRHQLADSGARFVVGTNLKLILPKLLLALDATPLEKVLVVDFTMQVPTVMGIMLKTLGRGKLSGVSHDARVVKWEDFFEDLDFHPVKINPAQTPAVLQYTGGTTGLAKGVVLTHQNLSTQVSQLVRWRGGAPAGGDCILGVLPLCHIFAMSAVLLLGLATGAKLVLLPRFDKKQFKRTLKRVTPTLLPGVPTLFQAVLNMKGLTAGLAKLEFCIAGGAPLTPALHEAFTTKIKAVLIEGYGLSECSPVIACNPVVHNKVGSVGLPLPGTKIEIRHLKRFRKVLKQGEIGEIWVSGPQVMQGYWQNSKESSAVMKGEWLRTGDVGYVDDEGYVYLTDRIKDIILVNGYNVYPRHIEDVMTAHPAVAEALAIGQPDPKTGETPHVYLALKPQAIAQRRDLLQYARENLSPIAMPSVLEVRDSLPKTTIGKPSRKDLKAELVRTAIREQEMKHDKTK